VRPEVPPASGESGINSDPTQTIGFTANVENPKSGNGKVAVNVKDKAGKPVDDATVVVKLSMPKHGHDIEPLALKHSSAGWYEAPRALVMPGAWQADVTVTTKGGDKVDQTSSFTR
jgi:nitrogen fixation protein FixH